MKLYIAEKPSTGRDIARVLGADKRADGYMEGNGCIVTWAVGHLVGLAEPEAYGFVAQSEMWIDESARAEAYSELPLLPGEYKLTVIEKTRKQYSVVKGLMHREDIDEIIDCGDMGAEGHVLQWMIREKARCRKPVKRFCATSLTDEAISKALGNLRDSSEFLNIIKGEFCKKKADWTLGMSMSRLMSIKHRGNISVGRVQTPTLYFVVQRYLEAENFKVTDYYTMDATLKEGFHVTWTKDADGYFPAVIKDSEGRVLQKPPVSAAADEIKRDGTGTVESVEQQRKATERPQLYDITELQRDANIRYGYSASDTLAAAQALYEEYKVTTYPRTDSRYITSDIVPLMEGMITDIAAVAPEYKNAVSAVLSMGLRIDKRIVDDAKVIDHHAIIATENIKGFDIISIKNELHRNVLHLILGRIIVALSQPYIYEATAVKVIFPNGFTFAVNGRHQLNAGWRAIQAAIYGKSEEDEKLKEEPHLPAVREGQAVTVTGCTVADKRTQPPKLHTEATLLTAMENAGNALGEDGRILKGKGIGTQATRAGIIQTLFERDYIERVGKSLRPTRKGIGLLRELPEELRSPRITADWETQIAAISEGKHTDAEFMERFSEFVRCMIFEAKQKPESDAFRREKVVCGECPWCKEPVGKYFNKEQKSTRYYCTAKCGWQMKTDDRVFTEWYLKKQLTEKQAQKFISQGYIDVDATGKSGKKYKQRLTFMRAVSGDKVFCNVIADR